MTPIHSDEVLPPVQNSTNIGTISDLVLKNELICENHLNDDTNVIPNNSQINIENSSDVIIGRVTQYHGPITIYQHLNGNQQIDANEDEKDVKFKEAKSLKAEEKPPKDSLESKIHKEKTRNIKTIFSISVTILSFLIILGVAITTTLNIQGKPGKDNDNDNGKDKEKEPNEPIDKILGQHKLIYRSTWGGRQPLYERRLRHPTHLVIISHTASSQCTDVETCSEKMQSFQSYHVNRGHPDIGYNFLIGGDANIYVGRGWDVQNFHQDNSIGISFIGNYIFDELTNDMIEAAKSLLRRGVELRKLSRKYRIVAHNQTFSTQSPGVNIYNVIKEWANFSDEDFH